MTQPPTEIDNRFADVNGIRLHYVIAREGDPVRLLHGYAENSHMGRPADDGAGEHHTAITSDLRGFVQSSKPDLGYYKKTTAQDVLAKAVGIDPTPRTFHSEDRVGHFASDGHDHWGDPRGVRCVSGSVSRYVGHIGG